MPLANHRFKWARSVSPSIDRSIPRVTPSGPAAPSAIVFSASVNSSLEMGSNRETSSSQRVQLVTYPTLMESPSRAARRHLEPYIDLAGPLCPVAGKDLRSALTAVYSVHTLHKGILGAALRAFRRQATRLGPCRARVPRVPRTSSLWAPRLLRGSSRVFPGPVPSRGFRARGSLDDSRFVRPFRSVANPWPNRLSRAASKATTFRIHNQPRTVQFLYPVT